MIKCIQKLSVLLLSIMLVIGLVPASVGANYSPDVMYQTHIQNIGWDDYVQMGGMAGTEGKGLRLEGIRIKLDDNSGYDLGIEYQTHIQNIGWEADTEKGWSTSNGFSGTEGLGYRLEAIQIKLTGGDADQFDIYYQVHAQNMGWLGLAKNGESAGTAGYGYRLEGIRIAIVPVGSGAPDWNTTKDDPFYENLLAPFSEIIYEYQVAEQSGYSYKVVDTLTNVNRELSSVLSDTKLFYLLEDLSGDSIPELVIASYRPEASSNKYNIYDIYHLVNGKPERIFDVSSMGYRAIYSICENQTIQMRGSGGATSWGYVNYYLNDNTVEILTDVYYDRDNVKGIDHYYLNFVKDNGIYKSEITETKFWEVVNSCTKCTDLNWIKL